MELLKELSVLTVQLKDLHVTYDSQKKRGSSIAFAVLLSLITSTWAIDVVIIIQLGNEVNPYQIQERNN